MLELVAMGPEPDQRWRRPIPAHGTIRLGRAPHHGWSIPWDLRISREHADIQLSDDRLEVRCLPDALNPAYVEGEETRKFVIAPGNTFRIGSTTFRFEAGVAAPLTTEPAIMRHRFSREQIAGFRFLHTERCLEVVANLAGVSSCCRDEEQFAQHLASLLLDGIPRAAAAAVVRYEEDNGRSTDQADNNQAGLTLLRLDSRDVKSNRLIPSRSLVASAMRRRQTELHVWPLDENGRDDVQQEQAEPSSSGSTTSGAAAEQADENQPADYESFTVARRKGPQVVWAFCMPLSTAFDNWSLYATGRMSAETSSIADLNGELRFAQLIADLAAAIHHPTSETAKCDLDRHEHNHNESNQDEPDKNDSSQDQRDALGGFFSPAA